MSTVRVAIIYSSISKYSIKIISLASMVAVSRLLTPSEIGVFAIASSLVMIMSEFRMLGAGGYLIREKEIDQNTVRKVLGLTWIISWGLGFTIISTAFYISHFYDESSLKYIFWILSLSFFLAPYISIPSSLLSRELNFKIQFRVKLSSALVGLTVTIILVLLDFSYYGLALGQLAIAVTSFIGFSIAKPELMVWVPAFRGMGSVASFGGQASLANFLKRLTVTVPDLVIGKLGPPSQVAIFSRGMGFVEFLSRSVMDGVSPVALPYLSKIRRQGGEVSEAYTRSCVLLGAIVWPVLGVASTASLPAIQLFFGDQWDASAPIASLLAIWGLLRAVHWFANPFLMASGFEKQMVVKEIFPFVVLFPGIYFLYPYGLESVGWAFVISGITDVLVSSIILKHWCGLRIRRFLMSWLSNFINTLCCVFVSMVAINVGTSFSASPLVLVFFVFLCAAPTWILILWLTKSPLYFEISVLFKRN